MRDFNAECPDRPGVKVGEDLADKNLALTADVYRLRLVLQKVADDVGTGVDRQSIVLHIRDALATPEGVADVPSPYPTAEFRPTYDTLIIAPVGAEELIIVRYGELKNLDRPRWGRIVTMTRTTTFDELSVGAEFRLPDTPEAYEGYVDLPIFARLAKVSEWRFEVVGERGLGLFSADKEMEVVTAEGVTDE